ncbi:MAG: amidohydrolase family protein [Chloroflexi bacterium]|nr:amidohydrolase family protein [Chloroflexota bacterium]
MIVDVRCRLTTPEAGGYYAVAAQRFGGAAANEALADGTIAGFFRELGAAGITTAVSVSGQGPGRKVARWQIPARTTSNDLMAELQRAHWGRFVGVGGIYGGNIIHDALAEVARCAQLGLRVVFVDHARSPGCPPDDRRGGDLVAWAHPAHLERVAEDFPELRIIAEHGCYPYVREAIVVAARRDNVYVSADMYLFHLGTEDWLKAVNADLFGFRDKFLFGTSYPTIPLRPYVEQFFALPWQPDALPLILYGNALRALALS